VLVLGAGFAGTAAAFAARRSGAQVTVLHSVAGASALYAGALDGPAPPSDFPQAALFEELCRELGLRVREGTVLATREGVVRPALGADSSVLDVGALAGKRIGVVDLPRDDWDAPLLTRGFDASAWARATGTRFELVSLELIEKGFQRRVSGYDFACSFERAERPAWLAEVLKAHAGPDAWLFGPWLGVTRHLARELTAATGVPVGEVTSPPGGVAGARFEARRDALLRALALEVVAEPAVAVSVSDATVTLQVEGGRQLLGDVLVVASGGFVSGGIRLTGALSGAQPAGVELSVAGLPPVRARDARGSGEPVRQVSSLFGVDLAARGTNLLEQMGLGMSGAGTVLGTERVFGAGDVLAPQPPSVSSALQTGLAAGAAAANYDGGSSQHVER
jgi:anaerobic glycerol-3-phosphate dehydrogenase